MCRWLRHLWSAWNSPVSGTGLSEEHRQLKHKLRNTAAKVDLLQRLVKNMREDETRGEEHR